MQRPRDVTQLLHAWRRGDEAAMDTLAALIYDELHSLAHAYMSGERAGNALQTTALLHERPGSG